MLILASGYRLVASRIGVLGAIAWLSVQPVACRPAPSEPGGVSLTVLAVDFARDDTIRAKLSNDTRATYRSEGCALWLERSIGENAWAAAHHMALDGCAGSAAARFELAPGAQWMIALPVEAWMPAGEYRLVWMHDNSTFGLRSWQTFHIRD